MIAAGLRDTRVAFEKQTRTPDGAGGFDDTWSAQFSRWCAFAYPNLTGNLEAIAAGSVQSATMADMVAPSDSETRTVTSAWRLTAKGMTWNIRNVQPTIEGDIRMVIEAGVAT